MYYTVQGHKMKEMQEIKGVKEMKVKEMQDARELKIMATNTSNMPADRQEYFAQEVARRPRMRTPRRDDLVAVPRSSHILLAVPVLAGLNYLAVPVLAGEKLPGRACVGRPMQLPGRACVGRLAIVYFGLMVIGVWEFL